MAPRRSSTVTTLFPSLLGPWSLHRTLQSANPTDPSGIITGQATFTPLPVNSNTSTTDTPSQTPTNDLLYSEEGEMSFGSGDSITTKPVTLKFSKQYIWRFLPPSPSAKAGAGESADGPKLSVWFVKSSSTSSSTAPSKATAQPEADYLFHELKFQESSSTGEDDGDGDVGGDADRGNTLVAQGSHLCVEDVYETRYVFETAEGEEDGKEHGRGAQENGRVHKWRVRHVVNGPKKEQRIESRYERGRG